MNIVKAVKHENNTVHLITNCENKFTHTLRETGVIIHTNKTLNWPQSPFLSKILLFMISPFVVFGMIKKAKADGKNNFLWVRNVLNVMVILPASLFFRLPFIWDIGFEKDGVLFKVFHHIAGEKAKSIVTQYPTQAMDVFGGKSVRYASKCWPITPGLSLERLSEIADKIPVTSHTECLNIVLIGSLCDRKNQLEVLKAITYLKIESFYLSLVGHIEDHKYYEDLLVFVKKNNIEQQVCFKHWANDIPEILAKNHVLLIPSKKEGLPHVLREGMFAGLAIVSTSKGGMKDYNINNTTGFQYPLGNVEELAANLKALNEDRNLLDRLRSNAVQKANSYFNEAEWERKYQKLFED